MNSNSSNSNQDHTQTKDPLDISEDGHLFISPSKSSILVRVNYVAPSETPQNKDLSMSLKLTDRQANNMEVEHVLPDSGQESNAECIPSANGIVSQNEATVTKRRGRKRKESPKEQIPSQGDLDTSLEVSEPPRKRGRKPNLLKSITAKELPNTSTPSTSSLKTPGKKRGPKPKQGMKSPVDEEALAIQSPVIEETPTLKKRIPIPNKRFSTEFSTDIKSVNHKSNTTIERSKRIAKPTHFEENLKKNDTTDEPEDLTPITPTVNLPKKRGRKRKIVDTAPDAIASLQVVTEETPAEATPPATPLSPSYPDLFSVSTSTRRSGRKPRKPNPVEDSDGSNDESLRTPVSSKRGRKPKAKSPEMDATTNGACVKLKRIATVICGVCQKEMPESGFIYHKYSAHCGLARPAGESQEFTEHEKTQELKKTFEKIKKVSCTRCSTSFTTLLGLQYHMKRCGVSADELQNMLSECTVCGKRVMTLTAHMKIHEKHIDKEEEEEQEAMMFYMLSCRHLF